MRETELKHRDACEVLHRGRMISHKICMRASLASSVRSCYFRITRMFLYRVSTAYFFVFLYLSTVSISESNGKRLACQEQLSWLWFSWENWFQKELIMYPMPIHIVYPNGQGMFWTVVQVVLLTLRTYLLAYTLPSTPYPSTKPGPHQLCLPTMSSTLSQFDWSWQCIMQTQLLEYDSNSGNRNSWSWQFEHAPVG